MVTLDFEDMFILKASLHPLIYAVKLKIEFLVLNLLGAVVGVGMKGGSGGFVGWGSEDGGVGQDDDDDVTWPSVVGMRRGSFVTGVNGMGGCLRCTTVLGQKRDSERTEKSLLTISEESLLATVSLGSVKSEVDSLGGGMVIGTAGDRDLEDLERQYLGQYR